MNQLEEIRQCIEPIVQEEGLILYQVSFTQFDGTKTLEVMICDKDYQMDLDTCEKMSDRISQILDEKNLLNDSYYLDVCSPGAERELTTFEQIQEAKDQYVHVELKDPKAGLDTVEGYLKQIQDDSIEVEYKDKTRTKTIAIEMSNVKMIRLAVKL